MLNPSENNLPSKTQQKRRVNPLLATSHSFQSISALHSHPLQSAILNLMGVNNTNKERRLPKRGAGKPGVGASSCTA
jgi:hypothetical protein